MPNLVAVLRHILPNFIDLSLKQMGGSNKLKALMLLYILNIRSMWVLFKEYTYLSERLFKCDEGLVSFIMFYVLKVQSVQVH